jgi:hypothetical protein
MVLREEENEAMSKRDYYASIFRFLRFCERYRNRAHNASDTRKMKTGMRDCSKEKSKNEFERIDQDYVQFYAALIYFSFLIFSLGSDSESPDVDSGKRKEERDYGMENIETNQRRD